MRRAYTRKVKGVSEKDERVDLYNRLYDILHWLKKTREKLFLTRCLTLAGISLVDLILDSITLESVETLFYFHFNNTDISVWLTQLFLRWKLESYNMYREITALKLRTI